LNNGRRTVLLLAALCVLPVLAAYVVYLNWRPEHRVNHGELLATRSLPSAQLTDLAGKPFSSDVLHRMVADGIAYASPWAWEDTRYAYDSTLVPPNLGPGWTDSYIQKMAATNAALGTQAP